MNIKKNSPHVDDATALWPHLMGFLGILVIVMMAMRHIAVTAPQDAGAPDT